MKTQIDVLKEDQKFLMVLKAKGFQWKNRHKLIKNLKNLKEVTEYFSHMKKNHLLKKS